MGIVRNLSCKILAGTGPILWTRTRGQGMTWSIGACHTAHSLLVFQTLAYIYMAQGWPSLAIKLSLRYHNYQHFRGWQKIDLYVFILFAGLIIFYGSLSQTQNREGQGRWMLVYSLAFQRVLLFGQKHETGETRARKWTYLLCSPDYCSVWRTTTLSSCRSWKF